MTGSPERATYSPLNGTNVVLFALILTNWSLVKALLANFRTVFLVRASGSWLILTFVMEKRNCTRHRSQNTVRVDTRGNTNFSACRVLSEVLVVAEQHVLKFCAYRGFGRLRLFSRRGCRRSGLRFLYMGGSDWKTIRHRSASILGVDKQDLQNAQRKV